MWEKRSTRRLEGVKGKPEERTRRIDEEGGWKERDLETWIEGVDSGSWLKCRGYCPALASDGQLGKRDMKVPGEGPYAVTQSRPATRAAPALVGVGSASAVNAAFVQCAASARTCGRILGLGFVSLSRRAGGGG